MSRMNTVGSFAKSFIFSYVSTKALNALIDSVKAARTDTYGHMNAMPQSAVKMPTQADMMQCLALSHVPYSMYEGRSQA